MRSQTHTRMRRYFVFPLVVYYTRDVVEEIVVIGEWVTPAQSTCLGIRGWPKVVRGEREE